MKEKTISFDRFEWPVGAFLMLVSGVLLFSSVSPGHEWGGDFAAYIHQGKALASGSLAELRAFVQYRIQNSTTEWIIGPDYYPWGFPALLAVVITAFGESLFAMKCLMVVLVLATQVATFFLIRGRISVLGSFAVAFAFGVNSFVFAFKDKVLSDIPFTFFVIVTLLLCRIFLLEKKQPAVLGLIAIGIAMFAAFSIRTHAIALLPTVALLQLFGKLNFETGTPIVRFLGALKRIRPRDFAPYLVFALGASAIAALLSDPIESYSSAGHVDAAPGALARLYYIVKTGVLYYGKLPKSLFHAPDIVYVFVIMPVLIVGVIRGARRNLDFVIFAMFHMSILLVFPGRQGLRFMLPVLPILFFFLFVGGQVIIGWLRQFRSRTSSTKPGDLMLAVILMLGVSVPTAARVVQEQINGSMRVVEPGPYTANSQELLAFIREKTDNDASIVFWKPRVLTYLTGRKSVFHFRMEELTSGKHDYLLVYLGEYYPREKGELLVGLAQAHPQSFRPIFKNPDFIFYEVVQSSM